MKTFNLILSKLKSFTAIEISIAVFLLLLVLTPYFYQKIKKWRADNTLIKNDFGYTDEDGTQYIKYIKFFKYVLFTKYNFGKTLIDFQQNQYILEDVFETPISSIKRFLLRTILIELADYKKTLKRKINQILIGWIGNEYIYLIPKKLTSVFISGTAGFGKSELLKSMLFQFQNIYKEHNKITVISSKPEDWEQCLTYAEDENEILEELKAYENQRFQNSKNKVEQPPTLILIDECHNLNKDCGEYVSKLIKEGRSKNIFVVLATQNSSITSLKNIDTTNITVKIVMRNTQTKASGDTLFDEGVSKQAFYLSQKLGFGWIKTTDKRLGHLIKFYYEKLK